MFGPNSKYVHVRSRLGPHANGVVETWNTVPPPGPVSPTAYVFTGVTVPDGADLSEVKPAAFVAVTVNVYEVPAVRPSTVTVPAVVAVLVMLPETDATVYFVMAEPPVNVGAVNVTVAVVDPVAVAVVMLGAPGAPATITSGDWVA
jgi:hypothetical protein